MTKLWKWMGLIAGYALRQRSGHGIGRWRLLAGAGLVSLLGALGMASQGGLAGQPQETSRGETVSIFHVPQADLARAPGYSAQGVFLPLSQLLDLADKAGRSRETTAALHGVSCTSVSLTGRLDENLLLTGTLNYETSGTEWSAALVDAGQMPWTLQEPVETAQAFLARVQGKTYLYAKGPGKGTFRVEALFPLSYAGGQTTLEVGRFYAPCRIEMELASGIELLSANGPVAKSSPGRLVLWPSQEQALSLTLRRVASLQGETGLLTTQTRTVSTLASSFDLLDELTLHDRFTSETPLKLVAPSGAHIVSACVERDLAQVEYGTNSLVLRPLKPCEELRLHVETEIAAPLGRARVGNWQLPGGVVLNASLRLKSCQGWAALVSSAPVSLVSGGGSKDERLYYSAGALPEVEVAKAPVSHFLPAEVRSWLTIAPREASASYEVGLSAWHSQELAFGVPSGWVLADLEARQGKSRVAVSLNQTSGSQWLVNWGGDASPEKILFTLHRAGAWGSAQTSSTLALPVVGFGEPGPASYSMLLGWPESLEAYTAALENMELVPLREVDAESGGQSSKWRAAVRVTGRDAKGQVVVRGREPDVRATVVSALSIGEDRAVVRAMILYDVRFAPAESFRFVLPKGSASSIRLQENGLRESSVRSTDKGDEWTVVPQQSVLGTFSVAFEWPLEAKPARQLIVAPEISVPGVTSQRGYVLLEGSEALRLRYETRGLSEVDPAEIPPLPWSRENRVLAAYSYIAPPYVLQVSAGRFQAEPGVKGMVRESRLTTTFTPEGERLTRADYSFSASSERQFFEVKLPAGARLWSALVNGEGVRPAQRSVDGQRELLLISLPPSRNTQDDLQISILYREQGQPLPEQKHLSVSSPSVDVPVNRTEWNFNLPRGFEYLAFGGGLANSTVVREPLVSFLRGAYYPRTVIFEGAPTLKILLLTLFGCLAVLVIQRIRAGAPIGETPRTESPKAAEAARRERNLGCLFGQFAIAVGIIALLVAIAVPNFLESQTRSKIARVKADQRSLATGIESYMVDNNQYPTDQELLSQGAVKYVTEVFPDPMATTRNAPMKYFTGEEACRRAEHAGLVRPGTCIPSNFWMLYSVGPDGRDDGGEIVYDPSNGAVSPGDVIRIKDGVQQPASSTYGQVQQTEVDRLASANAPYDPSNGTVSSGDVWRVKEDGAAAGKPTEQKAARRTSVTRALAPAAENAKERVPSATPAALALAPKYYAPKEEAQKVAESSASAAGAAALPSLSSKDKAAPAFRAGILSLGIELPEAGIQRHFEGLGQGGSIRVELLDLKAFLRVRFLVWMGAFLLLGLIYLASHRAYQVAFVLGVALTLLIPVLEHGAWVAFFNAAFQGILFSLVFPLAGWLLRSYVRRIGRTSAAAALLVVMFFLPGKASFARGEFPSVAGCETTTPVALLVPYSLSRPQNPSADPLAFISREGFTRLWKAAQHDVVSTKPLEAFLAQMELDGRLEPEALRVRGQLRLLAVNPADKPATVALGMQGISVESTTASSSGASLAMVDSQLVATLAPRWAGEIRAPFELPCTLQGNSGKLRTEFAQAASGVWRIVLPYGDVQTTSPTGALHMLEQHSTGSVVLGAMKPGAFEIAWMPQEEARRSGVQGGWRAEVDTQFTFSSLSAAHWKSVLHLEAKGASRLPEEIFLELNPGLRVLSVGGDQLRASRVADSGVTLTLAKVSVAEITLEGYQTPQGVAEGSSQASAERAAWNVSGVRLPKDVDVHTNLRLEMDDELEIRQVTAEGAQRAPTRLVPPGYSVQQYTATGRQWGVKVELGRKLARFDARVAEFFAPEGGKLRRAARVWLTPHESRLHECRLLLPAPLQGVSLKGQNVSGWLQTSESLLVVFEPALEAPASFDLVGYSEDELSSSGELELSPIRVEGAGETTRWASVLVPADYELEERQTSGAVARVASKEDMELAALVSGEVVRQGASIRSYGLNSAQPLRLGLSRITPKANVTVYNRAVLSDGLETLQALVHAEPRRGRIQTIEALLLLPARDTGAPSRIQATGPVRYLRREVVSENAVRVVAELNASQSEPTEIQLSFDQPVNTDGATSVPMAVFVPAEAATPADRAYLLVHRELEGDLSVGDAAGARLLDPAEVKWPENVFKTEPSDIALALAPSGRQLPALGIRRHRKEEALRAVVEVLRQRLIVSSDGVLRCELEMVVQNQSEQFLKLALPYPKASISIYEVQVASRVVGAAFGSEGGREVLLVPLLRTGVLEPELSVRVAFSVNTARPMYGRGQMNFDMPEVLGGIPVAQSALVLFLPSDYSYSGFHGSMNRVELVDLEVDEALRRTKQVEKLSQAVLHSKGSVQKAALSKLNELQSQVAESVQSAKQQSQATLRARSFSGQPQEPTGRLEGERDQNLKLAEEAQRNITQNFMLLNQSVQNVAPQQQGQQGAGASVSGEAGTTTAPASGARASIVQFPRVGDVFVFRRLQGTGQLGFDYVAKSFVARRNDLLLWGVLVVLVASVVFFSRRIFASKARVGLLLLVVFGAAALAQVLLDIAIPGVGVAFLLLASARSGKKRG